MIRSNKVSLRQFLWAFFLLSCTHLNTQSDSIWLVQFKEKGFLEQKRYLEQRGFRVLDTLHPFSLYRVKGRWAPLSCCWLEPDHTFILYQTETDFIKTNWSVSLLGIESAWQTSRGEGVRVAVVDTGLDLAHPVFVGKTTLPYNVLDNTPNITDRFGHGTAVAGVVIGLAPQAQIIPIKVVEDDRGGTLFSLLLGLQYALTKKAQVINLSLGSSQPSSILEQTIQTLLEQKLVIVAAAGNQANEGNPLQFPADYPGVLAVGAVDPTLTRPFFSSFGPRLSLVAPGVDVYTTFPERLGRYGYLDGTSLSAPFVTGGVALLYGWKPTLTPTEIRTRLKTTTKDLGELGRDDMYGAGLIQFQNLFTE